LTEPLETSGGGGAPQADARNIALLAHLSALIAFFGLPSFIGPLVVWLWQREGDPFALEHAREALNFNLSVLLYAVVAGVAGFVLAVVTLGIGVLLLVPIALAAVIAFVVLVVVAASRASKGDVYRYPFTIRFIS
jgi:uncharacterized Tic20 family protein